MQIFYSISNLLTTFQMSYIHHQVTILAYKILIKNIYIINTPYRNKRDTTTKFWLFYGKPWHNFIIYLHSSGWNYKHSFKFDKKQCISNLDRASFEKHLLLATKGSSFVFDKTFYKQLDGVAKGSPLGPTLGNSFLCYHEKGWLDKCPEEFKPVFYMRYADDIFVLFRKEEHIKLFLNYFNLCHENIKFTSEEKTNNKLSFLDIEISRDKNQFITSVYRRPIFSGVFSHFDSFIPMDYKLNLVSTLIFRCYSICCSMELFYIEITQLIPFHATGIFRYPLKTSSKETSGMK